MQSYRLLKRYQLLAPGEAQEGVYVAQEALEEALALGLGAGQANYDYSYTKRCHCSVTGCCRSISGPPTRVEAPKGTLSKQAWPWKPNKSA